MKKYLVIKREATPDAKGYVYRVSEYETLDEAYGIWAQSRVGEIVKVLKVKATEE